MASNGPGNKRSLSGLKGRLSVLIDDTGSKYWEVLFLGILVAYSAVAYYDSLGYHDEAQLFPQLLIASLLGLVALRLAFLFAASRYDVRFQQRFDVTASDRVQESLSEGQPRTSNLRVVEIFAFIVALVALIWLVGFFPAMTVFVVAFVYRYSHDLRLTVATVVAGVGFSYLLFRVLLDVPLWEGVLLP